MNSRAEEQDTRALKVAVWQSAKLPTLRVTVPVRAFSPRGTAAAFVVLGLGKVSTHLGRYFSFVALR